MLQALLRQFAPHDVSPAQFEELAPLVIAAFHSRRAAVSAAAEALLGEMVGRAPRGTPPAIFCLTAARPSPAPPPWDGPLVAPAATDGRASLLAAAALLQEHALGVSLADGPPPPPEAARPAAAALAQLPAAPLPEVPLAPETESEAESSEPPGDSPTPAPPLPSPPPPPRHPLPPRSQALPVSLSVLSPAALAPRAGTPSETLPSTPASIPAPNPSFLGAMARAASPQLGSQPPLPPPPRLRTRSSDGVAVSPVGEASTAFSSEPSSELRAQAEESDSDLDIDAFSSDDDYGDLDSNSGR